MASIVSCRLFAAISVSLAVAACSPTPVEPTSVAGSQKGGSALAPSPTPVGGCNCTGVAVQFDPGGNTPQWGVYTVKNGSQRIGFRINVTCDGSGESSKCTIYQIEDGTLTWTVGKQSGKIVGQTKKVTNPPVVTVGDPWHKEYSDALGADYPQNSTDKLTATLDMTFEIKCVSSDGTPKSVKFKVKGTVDAQAAERGGKVTLTNPVLTFTPIAP